ncbi:Ribonuclease P protein component [Mesomycoplasma dispar]|uniref:Ribonuclease P protein component n=1 Tax=Mesomycoplasma dispar TaxID=86660 RepID=A0AAJ5NSS9_9BACT|nr:ribonuclease P protein component [Mesomycoplasma dispar]AJR12506.1 ribonuclease P [Mesomycoplasma dispar]ATP60026.1 ribonuclease P protein component [Mesomycoplasma dispar]VEU62797.1 Ribonuclease P protein component [Mesomycoplasma dispar]
MQKIRTIKKNWEFQAIINQKNQIVTNYLILYYVKFDFFEIGISIPKKFANAVKRNYYKRQIKNVLHEFQKTGDVFSNFRVVLIARKTFLNLDFEEKQRKINKIFKELKKNEK